jgi:hypothetical protein
VEFDLMDINNSGILLKNNTIMNDVVLVGNMIPTHGINQNIEPQIYPASDYGQNITVPS